MDLDPRYLQAFYEVARVGGFSRAAAQLHKTQPTVSYQIRQLEQQLATRLFDRSTRRLVRTPAGDRLYVLCEQFFAEFARLASAPEAYPPLPLRIAAVSGFGRYVLFPLLAKLVPTEQPYALRFPPADGVLSALYEGTCDLGFVHAPVVSSRLRAEVVWHEELVLIAPPRTPRRLPRDVAALADISFVTYDEHEYVFGSWFDVVYRRQPPSLCSLHHFEELEEVVATVAAGRGWSIVPEHAARGGVVALRHPRRPVRNAIHALTRAATPPSPLAARIVSSLRARR